MLLRSIRPTGLSAVLLQLNAGIMQLVAPSLEHLPAYTLALATGWSPNNVRDVSVEQLAAIRVHPAAFVDSLTQQGGSITLPDGTIIPKLPFIARWIWDGDFCGSISLRWQSGTDALPPYVLGHIGYAVVPWKRGRGIATRALRQMLVEAATVGLKRLQITTDPDNLASQRVIAHNGGRLVETYVNQHFGPEPHLLYVIELKSGEPQDDRS